MALAILLAVGPAALAQSLSSFDLPPQPLASALRAVGSQTSTNVLFDPPLVEGLMAPALKAEIDIREAFARLLAGTHLKYRFLDEKTVMVVAAGAAEPKQRTNTDSANERIRLAQFQSVSTALTPTASSSASSPSSADSVTASERKVDTRDVKLQEVVVSATKRGDQDLQTTPLTITAFASAALLDRGIANISDISSFTAGLDLQKLAPGQTQVIIRGVTLGSVISGTPQKRATTGLYINDVSFEQNGMNPDPDLFDLERVEVLKGPQGTLFGSSAMAGAIRYVTKRPTLNAASAMAQADVSVTQHGSESYSAKGVINVPLVEDTLAMRLMAYRNDNGGWIDNAFSGRTDINTDKESGARLSTLWHAADHFDAHLTVQYQDMEVGHVPSAQQGDSSIYGPGPASAKAFETFVYGETSWQDKFLLSTLELSWAWGGAALTSVTGFVDRKFQYSRPGDLWEFLLQFYGADLPNPQFTDPYRSHKFSQELRITTQLGERLGLTGGVYFSAGAIRYSSTMSEQGWDQLVSDRFGMSAASLGCVPQQPDAVFCGTQRNGEKQFSAYGELDLRLSERFTLTLGGRWYRYDQQFDERNAGFFNGGATTKTQKFDEHGSNPKLGASYDIDGRWLLFASAAKGFRMGGVDDPIPSLCEAELAALGLSHYDGVFKADSLWTYELGAKSTWGANRVTLNGSVFDTEWQNIQTGTLLECGYPVTQNATKERIRGVELASRVAVTHNFSIELNGNYTDSRLVGDAAPIRGRDGDRAPYTPRFTMNGTLDYRRALTSRLDGFAMLQFTHRTASYIDYPRSIAIPAQSVANLRVGVKSERYRATVYVNNLSDELTLTYANLGHGAEIDWSTGRPRTVGLELQANF